MVHLRDGGERVGVNNCTLLVNDNLGAYNFMGENGDMEFSFPVDAVKMIAKKHYPSNQKNDG
jgi:hypothetical protein